MAAPALGAGLPLVRRGGYDKDAVDARLRQIAADRAGLEATACACYGNDRRAYADVLG